MPKQDCESCHYPAPERKKPDTVPQGVYNIPEEKEDIDDCPQCFYQGEEVAPAAPADDCEQCFYKPKKD